MIFVGFGTLCLIAVAGLVIIGLVAPDLFHTIIDRLREISEAVFPSMAQSLV